MAQIIHEPYMSTHNDRVTKTTYKQIRITCPKGTSFIFRAIDRFAFHDDHVRDADMVKVILPSGLALVAEFAKKVEHFQDLKKVHYLNASATLNENEVLIIESYNFSKGKIKLKSPVYQLTCLRVQER